METSHPESYLVSRLPSLYSYCSFSLRKFLAVIECKWCVSRALLFIYSFRKSHWAAFLCNCLGPAQMLMEHSYACLKLIPHCSVEEFSIGLLLSRVIHRASSSAIFFFLNLRKLTDLQLQTWILALCVFYTPYLE